MICECIRGWICFAEPQLCSIQTYASRCLLRKWFLWASANHTYFTFFFYEQKHRSPKYGISAVKWKNFKDNSYLYIINWTFYFLFAFADLFLALLCDLGADLVRLQCSMSLTVGWVWPLRDPSNKERLKYLFFWLLSLTKELEETPFESKFLWPE